MKTVILEWKLGVFARFVLLFALILFLAILAIGKQSMLSLDDVICAVTGAFGTTAIAVGPPFILQTLVLNLD